MNQTFFFFPQSKQTFFFVSEAKPNNFTFMNKLLIFDSLLGQIIFQRILLDYFFFNNNHAPPQRIIWSAPNLSTPPMQYE